MESVLKDFFNNYTDFSEKDLALISGHFKPKSIKKGKYTLKEGEVCKDLLLLKKGCLRLYYLHEGVEVSVWFAFEKSSAIEMYSFISGKPSSYFIQAIEDCEIIYLPKAELNKLLKQVPEMETLMRKFWEDVILNLLTRFTALQKDSAMTRYLHLMKHPEYLAKIPQKYLASFIGVTPSTLSRIRRRITKAN
ncbi:MAG TPA: Crp/Fnr family transcriptional regulator [Bacteroidia bacterium]|nr:Crp/Fnr family transcriptional regulator [Bacteroidia bacterium]